MNSKQYHKSSSNATLMEQTPGHSEQSFYRLALLQLRLYSEGPTEQLKDDALDKAFCLVSSGLNRDHAEAAAIVGWMVDVFPEVEDGAYGAVALG